MFNLLGFSLIRWMPAYKAIRYPNGPSNSVLVNGANGVVDAYFDDEDGLFYGDGYGIYQGLPMDPQPTKFALMPKCKS